jgi:hypothetical protein
MGNELIDREIERKRDETVCLLCVCVTRREGISFSSHEGRQCNGRGVKTGGRGKRIRKVRSN